MTRQYDAIVIGSGPNGLAAAITLAQAGCSVLVIEGKETIGGGLRSAELTLPGFIHDPCSAVHPLGMGSPFFRGLPLERFGLRWIQPAAPLAHPLGSGEADAVLVERSLDATAARLGVDAGRYRLLMEPLVENWAGLLGDLLGPLSVPRHPLLYARFGATAILPATGLARSLFKAERARALFAGLASHSIMPLERPLSAAFGLTLGLLAHGVGWPIPEGGSQRVTDALVGYFQSLGGDLVTGWMVKGLNELPKASAYLFDITPRQLLQITGDRLPAGYQRQLSRFRYGPGVFKVDLALDGPIPWADSNCALAGTVHLGGTLDEIAAGERAVWRGEHPERPFVLLAQQSLFDASRAPAGKHTVWAYCHVPNGSPVDMTDRIEAQIERFAPGFREHILARHTRSAVQLEQYNPNYIGGDINAGVQDLRQQFTRPAIRPVPYTTPDPQIFLCSSSTPPGGGVHGMCGYHAAQAALRRVR
ncbi:MAG: NAD(P)/FAD-dependent oxidoreductase [Anaerolineae bacterium]|nr:NAD(P)/FAD-dependent oxidoreductase [Anaerolineae bacterium]MCB0234044.1 NAD(P)/FAD-dependent oxidoreductase [Anaerolineae bacterium]MCB0239812.1 NAD(P)/FAD-dependent oxidoreductase [Anaerolineae bacterium]MCB9131812.1 NAD(P)/FAD-dependent oxidoreductase [Anaerolineales bacterium]HRX01603.1 NAD(P)/FAD-dependent oxidoreductase [Anaerolineae bacterium]